MSIQPPIFCVLPVGVALFFSDDNRNATYSYFQSVVTSCIRITSRHGDANGACVQSDSPGGSTDDIKSSVYMWVVSFANQLKHEYWRTNHSLPKFQAITVTYLVAVKDHANYSLRTGVQNIANSVYVSLSVCLLAYLKSHMSKVHQSYFVHGTSGRCSII